MHTRNRRISIAVAAALSSSNALAAGSVVFDNTLPGQPHGTTTTVPLSNGHYAIDASNTGYLSNTNLFESFSTFSIGAGEEADFTNSTNLSINNVISRVTGIGSANGLQPTSIDGRLVSSIAGAHFWFVNPAGVTIGSGATINVPAGLAIGTSDFIQFADNSRWYAIESGAPTPSVLATVSPTAFGFLPTPASGALSVQSAQLASANGGNLTLAAGGPLTVQGTQLSTGTIGMTTAGQSGNVTLQSADAVSLTNAQVSTAGSISISGGSPGVSLTGTQVSSTNHMSNVDAGSITVASAGPLTIQNSGINTETFTSHNAGAVTLTSNGAMSIQNGTVTSQSYNEGGVGGVSLTSSMPANAAGDPAAGAILIVGGRIASGTDLNAPGLAAANGGGGNVSITGPSVLVSGGTVESLSQGHTPAGLVSISATGTQGVGASNGGTGDAILITNSAHVSSSDFIHANQSTGGISVQASTGSVRIDSGSAVAVDATDYGPLTVSGATGVTIDAAHLSAGSSFNGGTVTHAGISLQAQGPIAIANGATIQSTTVGLATGDAMAIQTPSAITISGGSQLTSTASDSGNGAGSAGSIGLVGGSVHVTGGQISSSGNAGAVLLQATGTDASDTPALLVDGGASIESTYASGLGFGSGGSPGNIQLRADSGTVSVVGAPGSAATATTLDSSGSGGSAPAGQIGISGRNISLQGALINTLSNADSQSPGKVTLTATGDVALNNTLIDTESIGFGGASGAISISAGGSVAITGGQSLSEIPNKTNVALFSGASNRAVAGDIVVSASGPVTISNSTFDAQALFLSQSGAIRVSGSGVLIENQSLLSADYIGPGSAFAGGPGAVSIRATGTAAANDPLQADLTTATPGVVRIVDSGVTAINSGGVAGNIPGRGQVLIGTDIQGGSPDVTNNVVIAGSFISTDVLAGGTGNDLSITGSNGVWIGPSATGGYQTPVPSGTSHDPRFASSPALQVSGYSRSLISAQTELTAISGGQIFIQGGAGGVSIVSSNVDANDAVDGNNAGATRFSSNINVTSGSSGAVSLSDSVLTTETSGVNKAGNIVLSGSSVAIAKGELSAASTASSVSNPNLPDVGDAGSVSVTASSGSLTIDGAIIQSDATKAVAIVDAGGAPVFASSGNTNKLAIPNAGTVTLTAAQGSIDIKGQTAISTAAGSNAGNAGAISFAAPNGAVTIADSSVTTNVTSTWTTDTSGNAVPSTIATIAAASGDSGLNVSNSTITADTSGTVAAGTINLTSTGAVSITGSSSLLSSRTSGTAVAGDLEVSGSSVSIDGASLTASTTGAGNAGSVSIIANGAAGPNGAGALQVSGGAILASDASAGQQGANAGSVELTAANGTVRVGVPADLGSARPTKLSTEVGATGGQVGFVQIRGSSVDMNNAQLAAKTASQIDPPAGKAAISIQSSGGATTLSGSDLSAATSSKATASDIQIGGSSVAIHGGSITASTTGTGNAGNISIVASGASGTNGAPALQVSGGANIASDASQGHSAQTNAGYVKLIASAGTVQVGLPSDATSAPSVISTSVGANAGSPGAVTITGLGVDLEDAHIKTTTASTTYSPTRGSIVLNANNGSGLLQVSNSSLDAATSGVQQAGEIDLQGSPIQISNSTISSASTQTATGSAGAICVSSSCAAVAASAGILGANTRDGARTTGAAGATGAVLAPASGGALAAATGGSNGIAISGGSLSTSTSGSGAAGDITVTTPGALALSGTTISSESKGTGATAGPVGVINLTGSSVSLLGSVISAISNGGTAVAGEGGVAGAAITINSTGGQSPLLIGDSKVTTTAQVTNGSNIVVNAGGSTVKLSNSVITASAVGGNGGNITVNDAGNTALQRSAIVAQAGPGNGGAINIGLKQGALFIQDSESLVSATSKSGNNGTVTINSPQTDLNSALRVPEVSVARGPELTANVCRHEGSHSTFVKEGRGGVTPDPQGYLSGGSSSGAPTASAQTAPAPLMASTTTTTECP